MEKVKLLLDNLATQLLAYQEKIIENGGVPTEKELQFQVKAINSMAKLEKMIARDEAIKYRERREQQRRSKPVATIPLQPPVSQEDFNKYGFYVRSVDELRPNDTVRFNNKEVNSWWLEYNLFQYMLPEEDRRFIHHPAQIAKINYLAYREEMRTFIASAA